MQAPQSFTADDRSKSYPVSPPGPDRSALELNFPQPAPQALDLDTLQHGMARLRLLLVETDPAVRSHCAAAAADLGFEPVPASTPEEARREFSRCAADLVLLDPHLPGGASLDLLAEIRELKPDTVVIVATAHATVSSAVEAMRLGACDYITKPFAPGVFAEVLRRAAQRVQCDQQSRLLRERLRNGQSMNGLIGRTPEMEKVYRIISKVAFAAHPVLILGESGTGKEQVARAIHSNGPNASRPFVTVDLSSMPAATVEAELFGQLAAAECNANQASAGLLCAHSSNTVFLEEIGELSLDLQARLHRVLQEKQLTADGVRQIPFSARILATSSRNLTEMVARGRFRRDLFFRLNVVNIKLPPLRDRRDDILALAEFFLRRNETQTHVPHTFSADALRAMTKYDWPGNVRELEHAIERACSLSSGPILHMADLPTQIHDFRTHALLQTRAAPEPRDGRILSIADRERLAIIDAVRQFRGDKLMAARVLGIGKTTLYRKLKDYGIARAELRAT